MSRRKATRMNRKLSQQKLWSVEEFAAHIGTHPSFIYRNWRKWQRDGMMTTGALRFGNKLSFPNSDVERFLKCSQIGGAA